MSFGQCHAEELYVRVSTGEYFFGEDYIRSGHTDKDLFHELAYGTVVHEKEWLDRHPQKEETYVRVSTGTYFLGSDYIESGHTEDELSHELISGSVVRVDDWLKNHPPKEESNEQTKVQDHRPSHGNEGNMPVRQARCALCGARTQQETSKREVRYMCCLIFAGIVFTCLWLLYY